MPTFRHAHSSSLYSSSPLSLARQVERAVEAKDPTATLLTFTEVGGPERTKVLKDADPDHWAAWVPSATDVGIMWRKAQYDPRWKESHKLTDRVWTDGHGRKHETYCGSALLDRDGGGAAFVSVCHLPSHVQRGDGFYDNAQARAWRDALDGWAEYWNDVRKRDKPDVALIVADWNVDFHSSHWRQYVQKVFPKLELGWSGNMPPKNQGTHGSRLIDATWSTHKATKCVLLKDDASSDHRPYGEAIPW